jgi:hypothetical protein
MPALYSDVNFTSQMRMPARQACGRGATVDRGCWLERSMASGREKTTNDDASPKQSAAGARAPLSPRRLGLMACCSFSYPPEVHELIASFC